MRVERIDRLEALAKLETDWSAVYDADPEAQFFLSWKWMSRWFAALHKDWLVLAAFSRADPTEVVALLPLQLRTTEQKGGGFRNEINMGGNYAADYTGILCRPEFEAEAIPALAKHVRRMNWARLTLEYFRASDRRLALLMDGLTGPELDVAEISRVNRDNIDNSICPYVPLPAGWEAYLDTRLSANARQKLRRLLRQLDSSPELRVTHADAQTFERDLETLVRLWNGQWGSRKGALLPDILKNARHMLRVCFADGNLLLPVLWHGDKPVGASAVLIDRRKRSCLFYLGGRDAGFAGPSPGLVLHAHSIRHAILSGFLEYDFLRGNEPYKYSFGVEERRIKSLAVTTANGENLGGRLEPASLPFMLRRSIEHHRAGRLAEAERGYRQILEIEPRNADALYALGQVAAARADHAGAVRLFETLLADRPNTAKAWHRLGRSRQACGALPAASEAYCEALERQPAAARIYADLGQALLGIGLIEPAIAALEAARRLKADLPNIDADLRRARASRSAATVPGRGAAYADLAARVARLDAIATVPDRCRGAPVESQPAAK